MIKDKIIMLRCSAAEKKIISAMAEKCGLKMSEYCRSQAMTGKVYAIPKLTEEEVEYFRLLKLFCTNFNRIANLIRNKDPHLTDEIKQLVEKLTILQQRII